MASHFYVSLPSNSSMLYYPDNKTCKYTTKLHAPLSLHDDYEVGLSEIQFQCTWYNVRKGNNTLYIYDRDTVTDSVPLLRKITVKEGYYMTGIDFIDAINAALDVATREKVNFAYIEASRKCAIQVGPDIGIVLPCSLAKMLGFFEKCNLTQSTESPSPVDVHMYFHSFYVYSDILQFRHVGDASVPLLRTIAVMPRSRQENIVNTYIAPHYLPLKLFNFETIDIIITNETGEVVPFERGKVIVTLHFRERSSRLS